MRLKLMYLLFTLSALCLASPLFAQGGGATDFSTLKMGGIAMGIASGLCGIGQGMATKGAADGIARNPGAANNIRTAFIIGLVLIESLALYTFVIVFLKL
ncbi:MAG TPA: ATP synthase F0 subunit C [Terriglobales bacterium]|nr:ATP synthase F0 subunit C [Terriglobales bacterium]